MENTGWVPYEKVDENNRGGGGGVGGKMSGRKEGRRNAKRRENRYELNGGEIEFFIGKNKLRGGDTRGSCIAVKKKYEGVLIVGEEKSACLLFVK